MSLGRWTWLLLSIILACLALAAGVGLARELVVTRPLPRLGEPVEPPARSAPGPDAPVPRRDAGAGYGVITARNLFSITRGETMTSTVAVGGAITLHGVMVDGERSRAYLDDPAANRVVGYGIGDQVAGGRLDRILEDRVVIQGPQGPTEILLHDPSKAVAENVPPFVAAPAPRGGAAPSAATAAAPAPTPDPAAQRPPDGGAAAAPAVANPGAPEPATAGAGAAPGRLPQ
ncbi:MAG TPA: hypothetical protein VFE48_02865 [Methylomirabilota bacterium]|nr:hypothetical protein [Methylomirabilota bacterium]